MMRGIRTQCTVRDGFLEFDRALCRRFVRAARRSGISLGVLAPRYLDVCCYHPLWMAARVNSKDAYTWPERARAWANRSSTRARLEAVCIRW